jgi:hypothetical protein
MLFSTGLHKLIVLNILTSWIGSSIWYKFGLFGQILFLFNLFENLSKCNLFSNIVADVNRYFLWMILDIDNFDILFIVVNERKWKHEERIKLDRFVLTLGTIHNRLILTIQIIYNNWLVSLQKGLPSLLGNNLIGSTIIVFYLNVRFLFHSVKIFMQTIKQIANELTWVMLIISWKHRLELSDGLFQFGGSEGRLSSKP